MLEVADFNTSFNHSIISPLLSVWIQSPHKAHVRQVKFCLPITAIMITCPCYIHPLIPNFYKVKLGFTGVYQFLSHLLIAGCDIGVQISVRPYVRSFVRAFVRPFVRQHLRRSSVFSTSVIAASLKPCILIVLDIPFKHAPLPSTLDLYFTVH